MAISEMLMTLNDKAIAVNLRRKLHSVVEQSGTKDNNITSWFVIDTDIPTHAVTFSKQPTVLKCHHFHGLS
jgi:hypothetical protein